MSAEHLAKLAEAIDAAVAVGADSAIVSMKDIAQRAEVEPGYQDTMWRFSEGGYVTRFRASIDANGVAQIEVLYGATDLPKQFQRVA